MEAKPISKGLTPNRKEKMSEKAVFLVDLEGEAHKNFRASSIEKVAAYIIKREIPCDDLDPMADMLGATSLNPSHFEYTKGYETNEGYHEIWVRRGCYKETPWIDLNVTTPHITMMYTISEIVVEEIV